MKALSTERLLVQKEDQRGEVTLHVGSDHESLPHARRVVRANYHARQLKLVSMPRGLLHGQMAVGGRVHRVAQRAQARAVGSHGEVNIED